MKAADFFMAHVNEPNVVLALTQRLHDSVDPVTREARKSRARPNRSADRLIYPLPFPPRSAPANRFSIHPVLIVDPDFRSWHRPKAV